MADAMDKDEIARVRAVPLEAVLQRLGAERDPKDPVHNWRWGASRITVTQAVADALSLLANIVMAWNTAQMQQVLDHWAQRRGGNVPPELIGRIAPTRTEGINLRGIFRFPVERYVDKILPSVAAEKATAGTA